MQPSMSLACFLSVIRPPGVQFEDSLLQILPVDKAKCPFVRDTNDIAFRLFTRHNPTVFQELKIDDDEALFASNLDFHDPTVIYFGAFLEQPDDGSGLLVRQSYMLRGQTNFIILDISRLEAGPWYFTAAENTWYIGNFAAKFIDYMVSRGMNLNTTHLIGHSLGGQSAGVAGYAIKSGKVSRITGLDPALPLFSHLPLAQRLDPSDGQFVDIIHTDAGIFGFNKPIGHVDFYPNGGISPQPGCELEVVLPEQRLLNKCGSIIPLQGFYLFHLTPHNKQCTLVNKLMEFFNYINALTEPDTEPRNLDTAVHFKSVFDEDTLKSTKLAALTKLKLEKHNDKTKLDGKGKSILIHKLRNNNDEQLTGPNEKVKLTKHTDKELEINEQSVLSNSLNNIMNNNDSKVSYKREKRTNQYIPTNINKTEPAIADPFNTKDFNKENMTINTEATKIIKDDNIENKSKHNPNLDKNTTESKENVTLQDANTTNHSDTTTTPNISSTNNLENLRNPKLQTTNKNDKQQTKLQNPKAKNELQYVNPQLSTTTTKSRNDKPETKQQTTKLQRQKRFISLFKNSNGDNDNFLFKMLEFLVKNRKSIVPVVTVMREINTLVKSANGELNHFTKERNNYIGAIPTLTPIKYDLELGETGIVSFVKKLLGLAPRGGKLSISETK